MVPNNENTHRIFYSLPRNAIKNKHKLKTPVRFHYTQIKWPESVTLTTPNAGEDVGTLFKAGGKADRCSHSESALTVSFLQN